MANQPAERVTFLNRVLNTIEILGNKLPDPAVLFLILLVATWLISYPLANTSFTELDPRTGDSIQVVNQLGSSAMAGFFTRMVETFTGFHPLGVVLVALLGVGVAEHTGFINAVLKWMLGFTPRMLLTPVLILVAIVSHTAADAGYVLVIPLGGVIFYAAGRHPLAGIAAAFAGVSGGFSANFVPSALDPLLQGLTQTGAAIVDASVEVNPLCNYFFTSASSLVVVLIGWFLTDRVIEPRLANTAIDGDPEEMPKMEALSAADRRGMFAGLASIVVCLGLVAWWTWPQDSAMRKPFEVTGVVEFSTAGPTPSGITIPQGTIVKVKDGPSFRTTADAYLARHENAVSATITGTEDHQDETCVVEAGTITELERTILGIVKVGNPAATEVANGSRGITAHHAPLMDSIVPLIFLLFIVPGIVHGYVSGSARNHREIVKGMSHAMSTMGYYLVMAFFAALFIDAFNRSNVGVLLAVKGANFLKTLGMPAQATIVGIIILSASVNLLVGSASAKWALLSPIFVPMLMQLGLSPELTQAAYRVGDSTTNIITPLMPYFPLVVVFCQRYVKNTGIGTVTALMLPYSVALFFSWTAFLLIYWALGFPLGLQATYTYTMTAG